MAKMPHDVHMREIGMKSFSGSNGIGCRWRVMQSIAVVVVRKVWLSIGWFLTNSAPIMPEAPALLSNITGWPRLCAACAMTMRVETSDGPPGG